MKSLADSSMRQEVLDAAAEIQLRRSALVKSLVEGATPPRVRVVARNPGLNDQMMEESRSWRHLLSVRPATTASELRASLPNNRSCLAGGLRMTSLFDWNGTDPAARTLLRRERAGVYYFVWAPLELKVVDMAEVLVQGPYQNGNATVIAVSTPAMLGVALRYWQAVLATATPAWVDDASSKEQFTHRQRRIVELLGQDMTDQSIADLLGVSLRTVRYDVAHILDTLGVGSRFAAGLRLSRADDVSTAQHTPEPGRD